MLFRSNICLAGRVPDAVKPVFCGASLCALNKKGGGIRRIAVASSPRGQGSVQTGQSNTDRFRNTPSGGGCSARCSYIPYRIYISAAWSGIPQTGLVSK